MARPSDIDSKVVSSRIPMSLYMDLLSEAFDRKISISDLMLYLIKKHLDGRKPQRKDKKPTDPSKNHSNSIYKGSKAEVLTKARQLEIKISDGAMERLTKGTQRKFGNYLIVNNGRGKVEILKFID